MKFLQISVLWMLLHSQAHALIRPPGPLAPRPIDELQSIAGTGSPASLKHLEQSFAALKGKRYVQAIQLAKKFRSDSKLRDYSYWLAAQAGIQNSENLLKQKKYGTALEVANHSLIELLSIEKECPYSPLHKKLPPALAQAELSIADAYLGMKKWSQAKDAFQNAFIRLPGKSIYLVPVTGFKKYAQTCLKLNTGECTGWLQRLVNAFPKNSQESRAILELYPTLPNSMIALNKFPNKGNVLYKAPDLDQVAYEEAMKHYFANEYSAALNGFEKFFSDFPRSALRHRARFWTAQTLLKQKSIDDARKMNTQLLQETPLSYFGLLASKELGKTIDITIQAEFPMAIENDPGLEVQELFHLERARDFLTHKIYEFAAFELQEIKSYDRLTSPFLLYLAMLNYKAENFTHCFSLVGELIQREYEGITSAYGLHLIFPQHQLSLIKEEATKNGLDPLVVLSLIKQESAFDDLAISRTGALGLMQLMPATALDIESNMTILEMRAPKNNVQVGTRYLKKLLTRFNGNLAFALAAYNAGPRAVDRWIKDLQPNRTLFEFIETIPYKETREYVAAIIRNYFWYTHRIHGPTSDINLDLFWKSPLEKPIEKSVSKQNRSKTKRRNENA